VQLGEVDSDHGFRVFDYWARNKRRYPDKIHVAVLVSESASGRYRPALEELAAIVPLLVVEMRCWRRERETVLVPDLVIANPKLDVSGTPLAVTAAHAKARLTRRVGRRHRRLDSGWCAPETSGATQLRECMDHRVRRFMHVVEGAVVGKY
jgi:hypothetical protein